MATLNELNEAAPAALELLQPLSHWRLSQALNLYSSPLGSGLATQAWAGRELQLLDQPARCGRRQVELAEDGYRAWVEPQDLLGRAWSCRPYQPRLLSAEVIQQRLPAVLRFCQTAAEQKNTYLWGGSLGPDYDCSGLMQRAFASEGIWIPRDAYQQERFCQKVAISADQQQLLRPADLVFFGRPQRCTHVGLYLGGGRYLHSSGQEHGHNRIAIDTLHSWDNSPVATHYRMELRGAGRVQRCHDGSHLP